MKKNYFSQIYLSVSWLRLLHFGILFFLTFNLFSQTISCGLDDTVVSDEIKKLMFSASSPNQKGRLKAGEMFVCNLGIEIDSYTYREYKKDTLEISKRVLKNIDEVSKILEKELNIRVRVVAINIWKDESNDPFENIQDIFVSLSKLKNLYSKEIYVSKGFDVLMYLPTKSLSGAGGVASGIGSKQNVSPFNDIKIMIHELGHNLGSPHTHNCNWPGGPN